MLELDARQRERLAALPALLDERQIQAHGAGMRALFSALEPDGYMAGFGSAFAERYQDAPQAILDAQDADRTTTTRSSSPSPIASSKGNNFGQDGDQLARECPDITAMCGFWVGVATAWHVLNAINGKDGAR